MFWREGRFVIIAGLFKDSVMTDIEGIELENTDFIIDIIDRS